jgi:hypothetical protein
MGFKRVVRGHKYLPLLAIIESHEPPAVSEDEEQRIGQQRSRMYQ